MLSARFAATVARVAADLERRGRLAARPLALALPPHFERELDRAIAWEAAEGSGRDALLATLFGETLPTLRVEQALDAGEPITTLFHRPLDWRALPRFAAAVERILGELAAIGATERFLFRSLAELEARFPTLESLCSATFYGRFLPLLYAYPADLALAAAALDRGLSVEAVVDRAFAAPLVHELMHFTVERTPLPAIYLDECTAGHLGVWFLPEMAYPPPGDDCALYAAPYLAQVGEWLGRLVGHEALLAAQCGARSWDEVLGADRVAALGDFAWRDYRERRPAHLLSDNFSPAPWQKVLAGLAPDASWRELSLPIVEDDYRIVRSALLAMCLEPRREHGTFRVAARPTHGEVVIDLDACEVRGADFDERPATYLFPPALAARLAADGPLLQLPPYGPADVDGEVARLRARCDAVVSS